MSKLSKTQSEALEKVREGRVQFGHVYPEMARKGRSVFPEWLIDGFAAYGQENRTYNSLEEKGLIRVRHDLVERQPVPASSRVSKSVAGFQVVVSTEAHEAPVDPGWRADVEVVE